MAELTVGHVNLARGFRGSERQTELLIACLARLGVKQYFERVSHEIYIQYLYSNSKYLRRVPRRRRNRLSHRFMA